MKQICLLLIGITILGCSNKKNENETNKTFNEETWEISAKASENVEYKYQLMENFPTEGGPEITKEPEHAVLSEIEYSDGIYYVYEPKASFTGTDEVEITNNISNGAETVAQTILKLTIEVSE